MNGACTSISKVGLRGYVSATTARTRAPSVHLNTSSGRELILLPIEPSRPLALLVGFFVCASGDTANLCLSTN